MIAVDDLQVRAGEFTLRGVSFTIARGEYGVLMGRTGCGKTTLLEGICGLRRVESGRVILMDREVTRLPPAARGIGFVPQEGALFRHLTVAEHLGFALVVRRWPRADIERRVRELAGWLRLEDLLHRRIEGLSGGEGQRVALGRALSFEPGVLCLDEPLSALDDQTREEICTVLEGIRQRAPITVLHITHNLREAERLADVVLHLQDGRVETNRRDRRPERPADPQ